MKGVKVNYVREWIQERMRCWFGHALDKVTEAFAKGTITEMYEVDTKKSKDNKPSALNDRDKMKAIGFEVDEFE